MLRLKSGGPRVKNAQKTMIDGITFDSKMEANRYLELQQLARAGIVTVIEVHPTFELQPAFKKCCRFIWEPNGEYPITCPYCGKKIPAIRAIMVEYDFRVTYADGHQEIEDVKGMKTEKFLLKLKLFEYRYPEITLKIVKGRGKK